MAALVAGTLSAAERVAVSAHLDTCEACRALAGEVLRLEANTEASLVEPGSRLGRYLVLETIGAGAMGVVYAAYDPDLSRKVALKVLRRTQESSGSMNAAQESSLRARLVHEAQSLARLAHPNVVAIHDVGTLGDRVFLTMEFSEGGTLRDWLRAAPREWRVVVRVLRQAGEGLMAAHDAGLVHRDLKPENILIDGKERVRITDFGLARGAGEGELGQVFSGPSPASALTAEGVLVGTPAYMAPEQLTGHAADALSDQFAFCVTLFESLFGERPRSQGLAQQIAALRTRRTVPTWLVRTVTHGLSSNPSQRFASMREVLAALDKGANSGPRRAVIAAAVAVAIAAVVVVALEWRAVNARCSGAEAAWNDAWGEPLSERVLQSFLATGRADAQSTWASVDRGLSAAHQEWSATHKNVCEATRVRGEQSEALLDVRMRCLADRRNEVSALASLFTQADAPLLAKAVAAVLTLPPAAACARAQNVEAPLGAEDRAKADAVSAQLARATMLDLTGKLDEALVTATTAIAAARALPAPGILAKLLIAAARIERQINQPAGAEEALNEAAALALRAHDDAAASEAWSVQISVVGLDLGRPVEGHNWGRLAEAALIRAGLTDGEEEADRLRILAGVEWRREHRLEDALALFLRSRAVSEKAHSPRMEIRLNACDEGVAGIYFDMARGEEALQLHRRVAAIRERVYGAAHPTMAISRVNVGEDLAMLGQYPEAISELRAALKLAVANDIAGGGYYNHRLALGYRRQGKFAQALAEDERALEELAHSPGQSDRFWQAPAMLGRGLDLLALARPAEAIAPLERALVEQGDKALPYDIAEAEFGLGRARYATGAQARGIALITQASARLAPDAARYHSWFEALEHEMQAWLAHHPH